MPRINLLPWREQQRHERKLAFLASLGAAAVAAVVTTAAAYMLVNSMIAGQNQRNALLRGQIQILDRQIQEISNLRTEKQNFISRMQIIETLQRSRPEVVHLFDQLVKVMPDGTYLTSVQQTGNKLKLEGVAQSSTRVSTLMRNIANSQWLTKPELQVIQTQKDGTGSRFVLDCQQVSLPAPGESGAAPVRREAYVGPARRGALPQ